MGYGLIGEVLIKARMEIEPYLKAVRGRLPGAVRQALPSGSRQALPQIGGSSYIDPSIKVMREHTKAMKKETAVRLKMINLGRRGGAGLLNPFGLVGGTPWLRGGPGGIHGGVSGIDLINSFRGGHKDIGPFKGAEIGQAKAEGADYVMRRKGGKMYSAPTGAGGGAMGGLAAAGAILAVIIILKKILDVVKNTEAFKFFQNMFQYLVGAFLAPIFMIMKWVNSIGIGIVELVEQALHLPFYFINMIDLLTGLVYIFETIFGTGHKTSRAMGDWTDKQVEQWNKTHPQAAMQIDRPLKDMTTGELGGFAGISLKNLFDWTSLLTPFNLVDLAIKIPWSDVFDFVTKLGVWDIFSTSKDGRLGPRSLVDTSTKLTPYNLVSLALENRIKILDFLIVTPQERIDFWTKIFNTGAEIYNLDNPVVNWLRDKFFPGIVRGFIDVLNAIGNTIEDFDPTGKLNIKDLQYGIWADNGGAD